MVTLLSPYLNFSGNARQALEFYQDVFGGKLELHTFSEYGTKEPEYAQQIMHGMIQTPAGMTLMASDVPPGMKDVTMGNNITISLSGDNRDELMGYWDRLSSSGKVQMPMEKQMWGDEYGLCTDQFGIDWSVDIGQPRS